MNIARFYAQEFEDWERAEETYQRLIDENRDDVEAYSELLHVYVRSQQYKEGISLLEKWLKYHPGDRNAMQELDKLKKIAESLHPGDTVPTMESTLRE